jgi:hypothetical protein
MLIIVPAIALTTAPAAFAISGASLSGSAAGSQYHGGTPTPTPTTTPTALTPPPSTTVTPNGPAVIATPTVGVEPTVVSGTPSPSGTPGGPGGPQGTPEDRGGNKPTTTTNEQGTTPAKTASLPFTGSNVALVLVAALVLLVSGAALRRTTSRRGE